MKKSDDASVPDIRRQRVTLAIQCGDCLFFSCAGVYKDSSGAERSCSSLGTVAGADTCRWFVPDPKQFGGRAGAALRVLGTVNKPAALMAAVLTRKRVERQKLSLGEIVYFHALGGDYLNNYASGAVLSVVHDRVILEGVEGHTAQVKRESILTEAQWAEKVAYLISKNRINDPKGGLRKIAYADKHHKLHLYTPKPVGSFAEPAPKKRRLKKKTPKSIQINA